MSQPGATSFAKLCRLAVLVTCMCVWSSSAASASEVEGTPPSILSQSVSGLTTSNAVLEASIIPGELEGEFEGTGGAWYQFQIALDPVEFWPEVTCPEQSPDSPVQCLGPSGIVGEDPPQASIARRAEDLPTEKLAASQAVQNVSLDLGAAGVTLQPGTTYHYRVIAVQDAGGMDQIVWATPPVYGPDQTFTTPPVLVDVVAGVAPPPATLIAGTTSGRTQKRGCQRRKKVAFGRLSIGCGRAVVRLRVR
jgi:hypothetical protein